MRTWLIVAALWSAACSRGPAPTPEPVAEAAKVTPAERPADDRPVIAAFGDSMTAGPGVGREENYPAVLQRKLDAAGRRYRVVNLGVNGDTTISGLARLADVLALRPRIVILELGGNDGLRGLPVDQIRANLDQMIGAFQDSGARVVLAGMTLPPNYGAEYVRAFEQMYVDLARRRGTTRIPFVLDGVAGKPAMLLPDALHPNPAGYRLAAEHVWKALEPLL